MAKTPVSARRARPYTGRGNASDVKNVSDNYIIGVDEAITQLNFFTIELWAKLLSVYENSAERIARKATNALKKGRFKAFKTGRLSANHIVVKVETRFLEIIHYKVENRSEYAIFIHNGTKRIRKRPWLRSVTIEEEDILVKRIINALAAYKGGTMQGIGVTSIAKTREVRFNRGSVSGSVSTSIPGVSFSSRN